MVMTTKVEKIAEQVKALPEDEREEFLSWLVDFEIEHSDDWDKEIARDSKPGGRLERVLERAHRRVSPREGPSLSAKSSTTPDFWTSHRKLPPEIKHRARMVYRLWHANPRHPSLRFKKVGELWSVRIGNGYRALCLLQEATVGKRVTRQPDVETGAELRPDAVGRSPDGLVSLDASGRSCCGVAELIVCRVFTTLRGTFRIEGGTSGFGESPATSSLSSRLLLWTARAKSSSPSAGVSFFSCGASVAMALK
ncbi:MAG: hypothetical protein BMS9Abin37_2447 [Acidobacteriota bacterium]|nr:MAG: hypothetical protein BMS9Abin37_2447 [Acidobacteriota bacterium]